MSSYIRRVKLKSGKWRYYPISSGSSLGGYDLKKDAEARLARAIAEDAAGMPVEDLLFQEWAGKWLPQVKLRVKQSTWEDYESVTRVHLVPAFGGLFLKRIRADDIENWKVEVAEDMHPRTLNKALTILGTCLNDAVTREKLNGNVVERIKRIKEDKPEMRFLSLDETRRLLAHDCEIAPLIATAILSAVIH